MGYPNRGMAKLSALSSRYEAGFAVFMAVLAYLGRDNPNLEYPEVLYLFILLMLLNLAAGVALRLKPATPSISAGFILANCGAITAILAHSGGADSNLWVLYLLPIFTVCLLLGPRETAWITAGVVAFNTVFIVREMQGTWAVAVFEIALKSGLFLFTALLTSRLVSGERSAHARLQATSSRADRLATRLESTAALNEVALVSAGVAHDLGSTFTVILGFSDAVLQDSSLSALAREGVERVRRMAKLGGEMALQLARHGGDAQGEPKVDDLDSIGAAVTSLVKNIFLEKQVRLEVSTSTEACPVRANRVHLQRLFLNLLINALSVSKEGGRVRLSIRSDGAEAIATVDDDGPGFSPEILPRIFGAFETTHASSDGLGLGLNLCARIAREHGGILSAENRPEGGARLVLRLPLAERLHPAPPSRAPST